MQTFHSHSDAPRSDKLTANTSDGNMYIWTDKLFPRGIFVSKKLFEFLSLGGDAASVSGVR